ncbi:MAG: neutral/alkaline non-lysosomal ceramidase N-terminal domain-containing protein [Candidatus Omnitrophica bacterium]|nr:neutral/alkaline non-lysosomal ceramidase N-terminal domain-containing protein [Candidatus Omnitrophota bacterium]
MSAAVALSVFTHAAVAAGEVQAGVAKEQFVLPRRVPLAGFSKRKGAPSRGLHDPVGVRALVLQDEGIRVALVSCDLLIIDERLFDAVRARLIEQGLPRDLVLMLAATHTHSGPGAYGKRFLEKISMGHFDPQVFDALVKAISDAVIRAYAGRSPTRIASMTAATEGLVKNRMDPDGITDSELRMTAFYRPAGDRPYAVLVNFAAHPTALGTWNRYLSADYPGVVVEAVERRVPGATCLFFAGSVGDQGPAKAGIGFERAAWIGQSLAQVVVRMLETAHPALPGALRALQERLTLPPANVRLGFGVSLPRWMGKRLVDDDATLSLLAVGNDVFFGVPCDLTAGLGQELRASARSRGLEPMVIGFASDYIGYCISAALYEAGPYESLMAFNGPNTGELIVKRLIQMLDQLGAR